MNTSDQPDAASPQRDGIEIVAAVLLAFAAVATAWSSYQATRWNGEQAKAASRANTLRIEATQVSSLAGSQTEVDVATFIQWIDADAAGDEELALTRTNTVVESERLQPFPSFEVRDVLGGAAAEGRSSTGLRALAPAVRYRAWARIASRWHAPIR